ncbi:MAG TPA: RAMP superfamily CRISPR-associated protein [Streptosporangiaceae bacterium]|nr:RAMP superfamily CRISPR-associated protein [Streptosporangiaceae bacterium]
MIIAFIRFVLCFAEAGGVTVPGTPSRDDSAPWDRRRAHLLIDTDPWGRPHLPGTSLAGALRQMVRTAAGEGTAKELFGQLLPAGSGGSDVDSRASQIWVLGSRPLPGADSESLETQIRASTAISRTRAAAKANTLRVDEVLPAGSRFEVFLRWDRAPDAELNRFVSWLSTWRPLIGHGVSRGRGQCEVESVRSGMLRLDKPDDLLLWLTSSGPELARQVATSGAIIDLPDDEEIIPAPPLVRLGISITGPLRVGSGQPPERAGAQGQHVTPLLKVNDRYLMPGTGLKGLLRSRAEYILRSVGAEPPPCLDQKCGNCWPCEVFGHAGGHDPGKLSVGARAAVRIRDSWIADPAPVRRQHVAIDRFTGGAHPGLLYTVDALEAGEFDLVVEQLADKLNENRVTEILAVLRLVLEDLDDGITGIGAGIARGYGTVSVKWNEAGAGSRLPDGETARATLRDLVGVTTAPAGVNE